VSAPTTAIVPRWEWRTFGASLGAAENDLPERAASSVQDSEETYILSRRSDESVKVRGGLMDVKRRQDVRDGLELWRPVIKAEFPLDRETVGAMLAAVGVDVTVEAASYSLEQLIDDVVARSPELRAVHVQKHRAHHTVDDAMVELTTISCEGRTAHTIAVESPEPARIFAALDTLHLSGRRNVCVARGLKTLIDFGTETFAAIDIGTNSVKLHIGGRRADRSWQRVVDRAEVTRLGEGLDASGELSVAAVARTVDAIAGMVDDARREDVAGIAAVGTAALRVASNRSSFTNAVRARTGLVVEVLSGEDEARLAYRAATAALEVPSGALVVFDSGGGSTQFTFGHGDDVADRCSVDIGAVRVAERYGLTGAVSSAVLDEARARIASELTVLTDHKAPDAVIGMGGTATNLTAVFHGLEHYDPDVVHGTVLDRAELDRQIELYRTRDAAARRTIVGLQPSRAEVILAGACIVRTILDQLAVDAFTVSDRGLRHGLLVERFGIT
jgi:exopolyphosphatase/guanosine-5'-triphosphate,3'-diphosphate pyrophosphatase